MTPIPANAQDALGGSDGRRAQPFKVTRTFAWQEKVYSKAELVTAQVFHECHTSNQKQAAVDGTQQSELVFWVVAQVFI